MANRNLFVRTYLGEFFFATYTEMAKFKIQREEHGKKGAFFIDKDGTWIAEMTYSREGTRTLVIEKISIAKALQGKGVGKAMVNASVKFAEKNNLLIKPVALFVKKVLESSDEYEDILAR